MIFTGEEKHAVAHAKAEANEMFFAIRIQNTNIVKCAKRFKRRTPAENNLRKASERLLPPTASEISMTARTLAFQDAQAERSSRPRWPPEVAFRQELSLAMCFSPEYRRSSRSDLHFMRLYAQSSTMSSELWRDALRQNAKKHPAS